jgi:REP element-mobilizing transposase RayT
LFGDGPHVTISAMMIRAYHLIITAYGFWLPNDPRGSWSDWVRRWDLLRFGNATKVTTRRSVAGKRHDVQSRQEAKRALKFPPVCFTGRQALAVGMGFRRAIQESGYVVYACSILPDHAHLVAERHLHRAETIIGHLKGRATQQLLAEGLHPLAAYRQWDGAIPSPWARRGWSVFLHSDRDVRRAIRYVEDNPLKEGKDRQHWSFVVPFVPSTPSRASDAPPLE